MTQPKAEAHVAHAIDLATGRIFAKPIENRILRILGQQHRLKIGLEKAVNMRPYMPRLYGSVWVEEVLLSQVVARLVNNNVVPNTGPAALSSSLEMDAAAHIPSVLELISDGSIDATTPIENIRYSLPDPEAIKIRSSKELSILQKLLLRLK